MATVIGKTSIRIDELLSDLVVSVELDGDGNLLVTTRDGAVVNAGLLSNVLADDFAAKANLDHDHSASDIISGMFPPNSTVLPPNLRGGLKEGVLNLNTDSEALEPGHWFAGPGSTNVPPAGTSPYFYGWTLTRDSTPGSSLWVTQYAQLLSGGSTVAQQAQTWFRRCQAGVWQPWRTLEVLPIGTNNAWTYASSNLPNDNIERATHPVHQYGVPPSDALWAIVHISLSARATANASVLWRPYVGSDAGGWLVQDYYVHNHTDPAFDMGRSWTRVVDVRPHVRNGLVLNISMNGRNDPGSGSWITVGALHTSVTWMGHSTAL